MLFPIFIVSIMISFTPATAVIGGITAFIVYRIMKKKAPNLYTEVASIIGLLVGAGTGVLIYGKDQYVHQWHSLWWIPSLWLIGSLIGLIVSLTRR